MLYITGDTHGFYNHIEDFCRKYQTTKDDTMIILGDVGVNYYGHKKDRRIKRRLQEMPITFIMMRGNHDMRPDAMYYNLIGVDEHEYSGEFWVEDEFPSLLFTKEFGCYRFGGKNCFVICGAYSVDKFYRLDMYDQGYHQYKWFFNEQLTDQEKNQCQLEMFGCQPFDYILTHTCPLKCIPRDMFLKSIDQSTVDDSMERWLDDLEDTFIYKKWFCGHWHTDRTVNLPDATVRFMYHDIIILE